MDHATDGLSIPFFSFSRQVHSRTVSLTRTWTSGHGGWGQGQTDWVNWIKRPGSAPPSQIASRQDEEAGNGFEIQTGTEEISEVDRKTGVPTNVNVRGSGSPQRSEFLTVSGALLFSIFFAVI